MAPSLPGQTHWEGGSSPFAPAPELPGATPVMFFAPTQIMKRQGELGAAKLGQMMVAAWHQFATHAVAAGWVEVEESVGAANVASVYQQVLSGGAPATKGFVCSMHDSHVQTQSRL